MPTVDSLDIQISTQASRANASIDNLVGKLNTLSSSLSRINGSGLTGLANGVQKLGNAMQTMNTVKTSDFTRLANNLTKLSTIDTASINKAASSVTTIAKSFNSIRNLSKSAEQLGQLANGIKQLGYTSATKAIQNIPKLATSMKTLMSELAGAQRVSQNLIDMTNALAKLARTGASSGRAATSLGKSLDAYTSATNRAKRGTFSLASAIGKLYASYWLLFRAFSKLGDAINIASDLTEVQNVVDVTFGKFSKLVDKMAETSIPRFGMSELTVKQIASRYQAMGTAMGFAQGKMADMSINLTKLAADMASFYNVEQKDVAEDLESIFTGQTRPLRTYGLDLTQATLQEWALKNGLDANVKSMSQAEKTMLRYQYVLANTGAAQGDFARTANSWANSIRVLKQNFEALGAIVGQVLINVFKPFVQALNSVMQKVIQFARVVANALGKIFGWKLEISTTGVTDDIGGVADYADQAAGGLESGSNAAKDEADNINKAQKAAKKLKDYTLGIDELNIIRPDDVDAFDDITSNLDKINKPSGGAGGAGAGGGGDVASSLTKTDSIFKEFESEIDSLYELGEYIRDALIGVMESIDWESVYEKARGFGKGLAEFLNGILAYDGEGRTLFGTVGKTLANTLNTIIYSALEFAKEFDFYQFGVNLADGINNFFRNFDFVALAQALNEWVDGFKKAIRGFLDKITWEDIISGIGDFLETLELDTVAVVIGAFALKHAGEILTTSVLKKVIMKKMGITAATTFEFSIHIALLSSIVFVGVTIKEKIDEIFSENSSYNIPIEWKIGTEDWDFVDYISSTFNLIKLNIERELEGIRGSLELWWQDTWLSNAIWNFGQWWSEKIAPWFTQEQWGKLWETVKLSAVQKWNEFLEWWNGSTLVLWWEENVVPWFYWETWYEMFGNIRLALEQIWNELVEWWQNTALITWWEENVVPWFTLEKWLTLYDSIKTSLATKFNEMVVQWKTNIKNWWDNHVAPWFTKERWLKLGEQMKEGIYQGFKGLANKAVDVLNNVISALESMLNTAITGINDLLAKINESGLGEFIGLDLNIGSVSFGRIPHFATGAIVYRPTYAEIGERGKEGILPLTNRAAMSQLVSEITQSAGGISYGTDIESFFEEATYRGFIRANSENTRQESLLQELIEAVREGKTIEIDGREIVSAADARRERNGYVFSV